MLKKIVFCFNVVVASLVAFTGSASAIDYGTPKLPATGSNSAGSFIFAAVFVVCGVFIARFSSLRTVLRKN